MARLKAPRHRRPPSCLTRQQNPAGTELDCAQFADAAARPARPSSTMLSPCFFGCGIWPLDNGTD